MVKERGPSLGFMTDEEREPIPGGCCSLDLGFRHRSRTGSGRSQFSFRGPHPGVLHLTPVFSFLTDSTQAQLLMKQPGDSSWLPSCAQAPFSATVEILLLENRNGTHEFPLLSKVLL